MAGYEPQVGNIYDSTGTLIGVRDPATGVFTPVGDWTYTEDIQCKQASCNVSNYSEGDDPKDFVYDFPNSEWAPNTGVTTIRDLGDTITTDTAENITAIDYGQNSKEIVDVLHLSGADTDIWYSAIKQGGSGSLVFLLIPDGRIQFDYSDNLGTVYPDLYSLTNVEGGRHLIGWEFEDQGVTLDLHLIIDGVREATATGLVKANGWSFDRWQIGNSGVFPSELDMYGVTTEIESVEVRSFNFDTRLPASGVDPLKIVDSINSYVFEFANIEQRYPYLPYTAESFTGGNDEVRVLGDSNSTLGNNYADITEDYLLNTVGMTKLTWSNVAVFGMTSYTFAPTGWSVPARPAPDLTRNITNALASGAKFIVWFLGTNDITQGFSEAEIQDIIDQVVIDCGVAGAKLYLMTMNPRASTVVGENIKANNISDYINSTYSATTDVSIIDTNTIFGLGGVDNFLNPIYFADDWHFNAKGYNELSLLLRFAFDADNSYIPHLVDDKYQIDGVCVTVPAGQSLIKNEATGSFLKNKVTGSYLLNR